MGRMLRSYLGITIGVVITAIALNMFLVPNKVAAGGISGLATILHYVFGWPVGLLMMVMDIPLLLTGVKVLGTSFGLYTLYGSLTLSLSVYLLEPYTPALTQDLLLSALYGGVLSGIGLGLVFRSGGTTAGTDVIAAILHKWFGVNLGQALLAVDFFVIALSGIVFKSVELPLYSLIALFAMAKMIDLIQEGWSTAKAFLIMSEHNEAIAQAIMSEIGRGVTLLPAKGAYTGANREMVFCVVTTREVSRLKDLVYRFDRRAFVIVGDAHEVLGEGFKEDGGF